jgi:hypothetical protein
LSTCSPRVNNPLIIAERDAGKPRLENPLDDSGSDGE